MTSTTAKMALAALGLASLTACAVGPDYQRPDAPVSAKFKEVEGWKISEPQDAANRGPWWSVYDDPVLGALEAQIDVSNQSLKASEAAYRQAVAIADIARASFFPTVTAGGSGQRAQTGSVQTVGGTKQVIGNTFGASMGVSWELDLWGSIRRTVESDVASAQASAADLASARLSLQAALAADYFALRSEDDLKRLLDATVVAYTQSLQITRNQYAVGVAAQADIMQAETQLESTRAQAVAVGVQRAQLEHAIAALVGKPPADFSIAPSEAQTGVPVMPPGVPSALLERRPDIAAAERRMAAANAEIGIAIAAYYPSLVLSGSNGFASTAIDTLFQASKNVWAFGGQLSGTLFDGGARSAQVDEARALYDQSVANYRQTVLTGFQQVEDELAALRILAEQAEVETRAVSAARIAEKLVLNQYRAGTVAYTSVITAQTATLSNEQTALSIRQNRLTASVTLIQALGGGWERSLLPGGGDAETGVGPLKKAAAMVP